MLQKRNFFLHFCFQNKLKASIHRSKICLKVFPKFLPKIIMFPQKDVIINRGASTECARDRDLHWLLPMRISNPKIFGLHLKVMLQQHIYACYFVVISLVCPTKVSIMKLKCNLLSRMWHCDFLMKQIFFSSIFSSENKGRLAKQACFLGHDPWHTRYVNLYHGFVQDSWFWDQVNFLIMS